MVNPTIDLSVQISGKILPNPVTVASGVFGFGEEYASLINYSSLGGIFTKAVTPEPRVGNRPPRLTETPAGLINAIGLANPGLKAFLQEKLPVIQNLSCPVIVNVAGAVESDYVQVCEAMNECDSVWGVELNVSCPNVNHGGIAFGTDPEVLEKLVKAVREAIAKPLIVKLSPNVTDIAELARVAVGTGADALSCINTLVGMKVDIQHRQPIIPRGTGGLSGPAIRPVGVGAVWKVTRAVDAPVIGVGGIACADDALEYFLAGASAIQIGTALFSEPDTPARVLDGIMKYMEGEGFKKISDLHGWC